MIKETGLRKLEGWIVFYLLFVRFSGLLAS